MAWRPRGPAFRKVSSRQWGVFQLWLYLPRGAPTGRTGIGSNVAQARMTM